MATFKRLCILFLLSIFSISSLWAYASSNTYSKKIQEIWPEIIKLLDKHGQDLTNKLHIIIIDEKRRIANKMLNQDIVVGKSSYVILLDELKSYINEQWYYNTNSTWLHDPMKDWIWYLYPTFTNFINKEGERVLSNWWFRTVKDQTELWYEYKKLLPVGTTFGGYENRSKNNDWPSPWTIFRFEVEENNIDTRIHEIMDIISWKDCQYTFSWWFYEQNPGEERQTIKVNSTCDDGMDRARPHWRRYDEYWVVLYRREWQDVSFINMTVDDSWGIVDTVVYDNIIRESIIVTKALWFTQEDLDKDGDIFKVRSTDETLLRVEWNTMYSSYSMIPLWVESLLNDWYPIWFWWLESDEAWFDVIWYFWTPWRTDLSREEITFAVHTNKENWVATFYHTMNSETEHKDTFNVLLVCNKCEGEYNPFKDSTWYAESRAHVSVMDSKSYTFIQEKVWYYIDQSIEIDDVVTNTESIDVTFTLKNTGQLPYIIESNPSTYLKIFGENLYISSTEVMTQECLVWDILNSWESCTATIRYTFEWTLDYTKDWFELYMSVLDRRKEQYFENSTASMFINAN